MKALRNLIRCGIRPDHSFKEANDLLLINSISLSGAAICFILFFWSLPAFEWKYLGLTLATGIACLTIVSSNHFGKFGLAFFIFLGVIPTIMLFYVYLFGPIGIELYIIPGAAFGAYLLYPSKIKSALIFIYLLGLFVLAKWILLTKYNTPVLDELQSVLYFPNVVLALVLMYLATIIYRSQQEKQREELDRSNQVKQRLISIISHDLRSPVVSLKQLLDYASKEGLSEDEFKEYLRRLNTSLTYTSDMIDKVLFWANNQMKGMQVQKKEFPIQDLVSEVMDVSKETAAQKGIEFELHHNGGLNVEADPQMVRLVVNNVINNAIKFSPMQTGKVDIKISKKEDWACVDIQDNGPGMDDSQMNKLFSLEKTVSLGTDGEKGAGIGLVLSKELIELNGGDIIPFSTPGKGTSICLKLPLAS